MAGAAAKPRAAALVLGGAAVKGAFEAGALEVIASRGIAVRRIVVASSGAFNGVAFAAGVRAKNEVEAARELARAWEEDGGLCRVVHPSLRLLWRGRGISDQKKLLALLRRHVRPNRLAEPAPIELHLVLALLRGREGRIDDEAATTYREIVSFPGASFDTEEALERVFVATTASAALPVLFAPVDVPGVGTCVDGGVLNNTPIVVALGADPAELDAVLVVTATPAALAPPPQQYRGLRLLAHELDMVFAEWIYQDLRRANLQNEGLGRLDALAARKGWGPAEVEEIKAALGLEGARRVPVVSIRPVEVLPGTMFSGFVNRAERIAYVRIGRERATQALDAIGWR
jgi:predicted acylesterase/phospholipase RssA